MSLRALLVSLPLSSLLARTLPSLPGDRHFGSTVIERETQRILFLHLVRSALQEANIIGVAAVHVGLVTPASDLPWVGLVGTCAWPAPITDEPAGTPNVLTKLSPVLLNRFRAGGKSRPLGLPRQCKDAGGRRPRGYLQRPWLHEDVALEEGSERLRR